MKKITLLSSLAFCALNAYGAAPLCFSDQKCIGSEADESCYSVTYGMYETQYPWLNNFIWEKTFPEATLKMSAENIKTLGEQSLAENFPDSGSADEEFFPGYGGELVIWQQPEESGDYLQIRSDFQITPVGAAHGNGTSDFDVFKKSDHSPVTDIILPGAEEKLSALLQKAFVHYLVNDANNPLPLADAQELASRPISPSERWHFAKNVIVFDYSPYDIAAYAFGDIYLPVSTDDLKGLVREDILQAAKNWPVDYNADPYRYPEYCGEENY